MRFVEVVRRLMHYIKIKCGKHHRRELASKFFSHMLELVQHYSGSDKAHIITCRILALASLASD